MHRGKDYVKTMTDYSDAALKRTQPPATQPDPAAINVKPEAAKIELWLLSSLFFETSVCVLFLIILIVFVLFSNLLSFDELLRYNISSSNRLREHCSAIGDFFFTYAVYMFSIFSCFVFGCGLLFFWWLSMSQMNFFTKFCARSSSFFLRT